MSFGKNKYWIIGGIIGAVLALIYDLYGLILYGVTDSFISWFLFMILDFIIFFIVGALIGLLIKVIITRRRERHSRKIIQKNKPKIKNKAIKRKKK